MNEPPGARSRVALTGLTLAEYFRDEEGQDVLFLVDNIFRFTQAGSEVSALLGRIPSAVGYQPTLATDMGALQERITTTNKGSITSVQAIYVPASPTLMLQLFYHVKLQNSASIPRWIRLTLHHGCWIQELLVNTTTTLPVKCKKYYNNTNRCRILSLSLVWMNCLKKIS